MDIQQFYTVTKDNFKLEFNKIPKDCLCGLHIHERHRTPEYKFIPEDIWKYISMELELTYIEQNFHILPEVHHAKQVEETYKFCKEIFNL